MHLISTQTKERLTESLLSYYETMSKGELKKLSSLMTEESYLTLIKALGFKRSFKDKTFQSILKKSDQDHLSLETVEAVLSTDLAKEAVQHKIVLISFETKGPQRITVHYTEDDKLKKVYFSSTTGKWKIDYNAGRKIT